MDKYYEIANAKRPEFLRTGDFSMTAYGDEGERYINEYKDICARAEKLYEKLPTDKQASFFELGVPYTYRNKYGYQLCADRQSKFVYKPKNRECSGQ